MKKITKIEIIMSVDEDADLYSRDITLNGERFSMMSSKEIS